MAAEGGALSIEVEACVPDLIARRALDLTQRRPATALGIIGIFSVALGTAFGVSGSTLLAWLLIPWLVVLVYEGCKLVLSLTDDSSRQTPARKVPSLLARYTVDARGLTVQTAGRMTRHKWRVVTQIEQTRYYLRFFDDQHCIDQVPRRAFNSPQACAAFIGQARAWKAADALRLARADQCVEESTDESTDERARLAAPTTRQRLRSMSRGYLVAVVATVAVMLLAARLLPSYQPLAILLGIGSLLVIGAAQLRLLLRIECPACRVPLATAGIWQLGFGRGSRSINYCPHCRLSLHSRAEVPQ